MIAGARNEEKLNSLAEETGIEVFKLDATQPDQVDSCITRAVDLYGRIDGVANCVAPGLVRTPLTSRITENEAALKGSLAMHALGRIGEASDVASAMEWLLDPAQAWVTGQVIGVDGGLASLRPR